MSNRIRPFDVEGPHLREAEIRVQPHLREHIRETTPVIFFMRILEGSFAGCSAAGLATNSNFSSVTAFRYLVVTLSLQCFWSLSLAILAFYAMVRRRTGNARLLCFITIGDAITSTLLFAAASASAGILVLIESDFHYCAQNHCNWFGSYIIVAFGTWGLVLMSFFWNFWFLASYGYPYEV